MWNQPCFMSDTTPQDITWTLNQLPRGVDNIDPLLILADRRSSYIQSCVCSVQADSFWTFPHSFHMMASTDLALYEELGEAVLLIFKGDLNYSKLVGDLNWETTVAFKTTLPFAILSLRTAKADMMVRLEAGQ
jgi:hypothetical protein